MSGHTPEHMVANLVGPFAEEYARRISAAAKATAGIPTEALEADVVKRMRALLASCGAHGLYEGPDDMGMSKAAKRAQELSFEIRAILKELGDA